MNNAQTTSWQVEKGKHLREMKYMGRLERGSCWDVLKEDMLFKIYYKATLTIIFGGVLLKRELGWREAERLQYCWEYRHWNAAPRKAEQKSVSH